MKKTPNCLLLILLALISPTVHAAPDLFPGYYITKKGDSVQCNVEYHDWYKNPKTIVVEVNHVKTTLGVADIEGFGVTGYGDYKSAAVSYHTNPVSGPNIPSEFSDQVETDNCFLKVVTSGIYSLYELVLSERHYYFIQEKDSVLTELVYRVKIDPDGLTAIPDLRYKIVFSELFTKANISGDYQYLITTAKYNKSSLELLVDKLNETKTGKKVVRAAEKGKFNRLQIDIFAGGLINSFPDPIDGHFTTMNKMPTAFSPSGGISFRYILPGSYDAFSLGASIGVDTYKSSVNRAGIDKDSTNPNAYSVSTYTEKLAFSNTILMTNFNVQYRFTRNDKINFFVKAGVGFQLSIAGGRNVHVNYSDTMVYAYNGILQPTSYGSYQESRQHFVDVAASLNLSVGLMTGRSKLEAAYYVPTQWAANGETSFRIAQYGLYYYFTILK